MAEQTPPNTGDQDQTKNLKAEMERKLSNIQSDMKKSSDALAAQLAQLAAKLTPPAPTKSKTDEQKELEEEVWDNPVAFKQRVVKEAQELSDKKFSTYIEQQQAAAKQLGELYASYPELQQQNHPLAARSLEIFNGLSAEEKGSLNAFKLAVAQAASENGIKPVSKRQEEEMDDFTLNATGKKRKAGPKVEKNTEVFAQAMGVDMSNEKIRKEIESYAAYTPEQWRKWK